MLSIFLPFFTFYAVRPSTMWGRHVRIPDPPPPQTPPPKFSNPSFYNFRFWGKGLAPKGPKKFFALLEGENLFSPYVSKLKTLRILWRLQKCLKSIEKFLTPDLTFGSDLG